MMNRPPLAYALLLALLLPACGADDDAAPRAKHLVFLTVDTLRRDRLGCYGGENQPSPNIDRLAAEGALFLDAFTPRGMTLPSFASYFTSKYPTQHGVVDNLKQIPAEEYTLAERLADAGFHNRAFNASGVLKPGRGGVEQGYEPRAYTYIEDERELTNRAEYYLRNKFGQDGRREFLWVHYMNPHKPYEPPGSFATKFTDPDYAGGFDGSSESLDRIFVEQLELTDADRRHIEGLYDGTIAFVDECVGRLLAALADSGHAEDTLVVFASDHGEDLYSHNRYYYHANSIYSATTALALAFHQPGEVAPQRVRGLVENVDFMPTVLAWLGVDPTAGGGAPGQGVDLGPVLRGEQDVRRDFAIAFTGQYAHDADSGRTRGVFSARNLDWHYVWNPDLLVPGFPPEGRDYLIPRAQLFHVAEDPDEQVDLSGQRPEPEAALRRAIDSFLSRYVDDPEVPDYLTADKIDELHQQGYISAREALRLKQKLERMATGGGARSTPGDGSEPDRAPGGEPDDHEDDC